MNWFERHLNWSLFLAYSVVPSIIFGIFFAIFFVVFYGGMAGLAASGAGESAIASYLFTAGLPFLIIYFVILLGDLVFDIVVTLWYLGQKARNKWLTLLLFVPFGLIILLLLENQAVVQGGDFTDELPTNRWQDTGPYSAPDDRQLKELDYTPDKNVMDMVGSGDVKEVKDIGDVGAAGAAGEEAPAEEKAPAAEEVPAEEKVEEKVVEKIVSQERLKMPILMDDTGAAIRCFYHPGADAVNLCSRCKQYVCNECNYVTGTHPICRNCWEKRAEVAIAPPAQKPVSPPSVKPEKQESLETGKPKKQKIAAPGKAEKPEAKKYEWLPEFMTLYEQAAPIINVVIRKSADGMPASPLDLMEGLKLRPMLERAKKLSKPKEKELREAKNEFEQVLSSCIKIADAAADFVSGGGQALLGGPDFKRIVDGIETASGLMGKLSQRLSSFSQSQV